MNVGYSYVCDVLTWHRPELPLWITELGDNSSDRTTQADRIRCAYLVCAYLVFTALVLTALMGLAEYNNFVAHEVVNAAG